MDLLFTHLRFIRRLWLSANPNFSSHERPKRKRPPKPKRKGEKAPSVAKKPVKDVIAAFEEALKSESFNPLEPLGLLWELFDSIFLAGSEQRGLIDFNGLVLAGDGTPVVTSARERCKRVCDCRERGITDCTCDRYFSQPDCDWGYDSSRNSYFRGFHAYLLSDPSSGHDLPIFATLGPGSQHDAHGFAHTWFQAKAWKPEFQAKRLLLDAAHDALAIYELLQEEGAETLIDLNKGHQTPPEAKGYTIGPDGIPICANGHPMKYAGFDKAQHRLKYRCPLISRKKNGPVCSCDNPCTTARYGRQVHLYPKSNPRWFCSPPRGTETWKKAYNARTGSERANKRIKNDHHLEMGHHRSSMQWYTRLFLIMMCIHHDAWSQIEEKSAATA